MQHEIAPLSQENKKRRSKSRGVLNCFCDCTSLLNIYICNTLCTCSVLSGCSFAQWRYVTWDARKANFCWGRRAKTSSCLPKSCQVMKTTLKAAGMAWPGILCQQRRQIFQQVKSCFHLSCQPGKDVASSIWLGAVQRLSIDKITFKSKVESYKTGIYKKVPSTTL